MATRQKSKAADTADSPTFTELVSPDGQRKVTPKTALDDSRYRFDGYLPAEQQKEPAPEPVTDGGPQTVGTNA